MSEQHYGLVVTVEDAGGGHNVKVNGRQAYFRPYDGRYSAEIVAEIADTFGKLLRAVLGHDKEKSWND